MQCLDEWSSASQAVSGQRCSVGALWQATGAQKLNYSRVTREIELNCHGGQPSAAPIPLSWSSPDALALVPVNPPTLDFGSLAGPETMPEYTPFDFESMADDLPPFSFAAPPDDLDLPDFDPFRRKEDLPFLQFTQMWFLSFAIGFTGVLSFWLRCECLHGCHTPPRPLRASTSHK
jgi:hypothetical protein